MYMLKKSEYIKGQILNLNISRMLVTLSSTEIFSKLTDEYSVSELSTIIDNYIENEDNSIFIVYFSCVKEKLREIVEMLLFRCSDILKEECELHVVQEEYEITYDELKNALLALSKKKPLDEKKIAEELLSNRNLNNGLDNYDTLNQSYCIDYFMATYLNFENSSLPMFDGVDSDVLAGSIIYYLRRVEFFFDKELAFERINYICENYGIEINKKSLLLNMFHDSTNRLYIDFISEHLDGRDALTGKQRQKVIPFKDYSKK